jgi:phage/plasmid-like protein (TIGR03299 family)
MSQETLNWLNENVLVGMTTQRGNAWHYRADLQTGEGNHYPGPIPVEDVQRRLFGWSAQPRRVAVEVPANIDDCTHIADDGTPMKWVIQDDRQAIAASDNHHVFNLFKSGYQPHNFNEWLLDTVAQILDDDLVISSAGLLRGRAVAWVEVSVPETIIGAAGVAFRPNLVACTSHDGTLATTFKRTITATVCDNTLSAALGEAGQQFKARHSKYSGLKLGKARDALNIVHNTADAFNAEVERLTSWKISDVQMKTVIDTLVPIDPNGSKAGQTQALNKQCQLWNLLLNDQRVAPWRGTAFGVVQAFNTWEHHVKGTRGGTQRAERNMFAALDGTTEKSDAEVLKVLAAVS